MLRNDHAMKHTTNVLIIGCALVYHLHNMNMAVAVLNQGEIGARSMIVGRKGKRRFAQMRLAACQTRNRACWTPGP